MLLLVLLIFAAHVNEFNLDITRYWFSPSYLAFTCERCFTSAVSVRVQGGPSQRGQSSSLQQKSQVNKSSYGSSPYWANWDGEMYDVCARLHGERPTHKTTSALSDWRDHTGTNHFTTQSKIHTHTHTTTTPPPTSPFALYIPLFKFMAVVCKIYLCMYLYSIYVLVGHKMWFSAFLFFLFWRTFYFKKKCGKTRMLNHGDEVGEYTWTQASCDVDFFLYAYINWEWCT